MFALTAFTIKPVREDCIPLLKRAGASADVELLQEMFLRYYRKYSTVKTNEQEGERN